MNDKSEPRDQTDFVVEEMSDKPKPSDHIGVVVEKPTEDNNYSWLIDCAKSVCRTAGHRLTGWNRPNYGAYEVGDLVVMGYRSGSSYGLWFVISETPEDFDNGLSLGEIRELERIGMDADNANVGRKD